MGTPWTPTEVDRLRKLYNSRPRPRYATMADILGRSTDSIRNKIFTLRKESRNDWLDEERIAFFDIETSHLKANIGNMISWAIKPLGGETKFAAWTRKEAINWDKMDRRIMKELIEELKKYDLIVTYYGTNFDMKFIRTRAMVLGLPGFPEYGTIKHFDAYYAVRRTMALYSNRLAVVTQALGIEGKTPLPPSIWGKARLGYDDVMDEVEEHNVEDVIILEELYKEILPYIQITRKSI